MPSCFNRREFLQAAGGGAAAAGLGWTGGAWGADEDSPAAASNRDKTKDQPRQVAEHSIVTIAGKPRERGRQYGAEFRDAIHAFLEREIIEACAPHSSRAELLRYSRDCGKLIDTYSPTIAEELDGMAEGTGLTRDEIVLITAHEETAGHKESRLPPVTHCTAIAAGPPDTSDGCSYVGQNWDWMDSVYGLSQMLRWQRPEGPSLISYSYPGLWAGAGMNDRGVALCWTWGDGLGIKSPRVGIPAYVLIAQMLYQETLDDALEEARRAKHAGWFAFVLADGEGNIAAVDGTPEALAVQRLKGHTARASYACREVLGGKTGEPLSLHPQCARMFDILDVGRGKFDRGSLQATFADHHEWQHGEHRGAICKHPHLDKNGKPAGFTVDSMLYDCTNKVAHVSRGPGCSGRWKSFGFETKPATSEE